MKRHIKNIFFGIIILAGIAFLIKVSGWTPLNLLLGPQYESKKQAVTVKAADTSPFKVASHLLLLARILAVETCGVFLQHFRFGFGFFGPRGCF